MSNIFLKFPFPCLYKSVDCKQSGISYTDLHNLISTTVGLSDFSLHCNGKKIFAEHHVLPNSTVHISFPLPGGKGGFGSMLRAIGAQIEKTTNREACRDLSGRRLRDINEEQRLKNWISKKSEREAEKVRRRRERLERLKSRPKHNFVDFEYEKEISELPERIDDALSAGMVKAKKRPTEVNEPSTSGNNSKKKKRLWLDEGISESSEESDSDSSKSNKDCDELRGKEDVLSSMNAEETLCSNSESSSSSTLNVFEEKEPACSATPSPHNNGGNSSLSESQEGEKQETTLDSNQDSDALKFNQNLDNRKDVNEEPKDDAPVDLNDYQSVEELEKLGLERLKNALTSLGLKCGGNLSDRAGRLWAVRGLNPDQYPKNFLAKQKKKK